MEMQAGWILEKGFLQKNIDMKVIEKCVRRDCMYHFRTLSYGDLDKKTEKIIPDQGNRTEITKDFLPVGSLAFVAAWLKEFYGKQMHPIEVPAALRKPEFLGRGYWVANKSALYRFWGKSKPGGYRFFVKDGGKLKEFNSSAYEGKVPYPETLQGDGPFVVSEWMDIRSEFRVFVNDDEILAVQNYLGNPLVFPDPCALLDMVEAYKEDAGRPGAYTLDIAVINAGGEVKTVILEVHPFVSCGLYGFEDIEIPDMLRKGMEYYIESENNRPILTAAPLPGMSYCVSADRQSGWEVQHG